MQLVLFRHRSALFTVLVFGAALAGSYWMSSSADSTFSSSFFRWSQDRTRDSTAPQTKQEVWIEPSDMPYWVHKFPFMALTENVAVNERICYVHVGKTAGSTVACNLGFKYDSCDQDHVRLPAGKLPNTTTNLIHNMYNDCARDEYDMFLFVVREPLARMESWFTYERIAESTPVWNKKHFAQKRKLFLDCPFPTLNALGGARGLGANNSTECSERAWQAIKGTVGYFWHNHYNYDWYYNRVLDVTKQAKPRIAVIRTEHLEDDWRSVEMDLLQGPKPFADDFSFSKKHSSEKRMADRYLSKRSQANICKVLCDEIQIYKRILREAINLDASDYEISLQELVQRCPKQATVDSC